MLSTKSKILIASNSSRNRQRLLSKLVTMRYSASCASATDVMKAQGGLRVTRPDLVLFDLSCEPIDDALPLSRQFAERLKCPILYSIDPSKIEQFQSQQIQDQRSDLNYITQSSTPHELELAISHRILQASMARASAARRQEKWAFQALSIIAEKSLPYDQAMASVLGILATSLDACCCVLAKNEDTKHLRELVAVGTKGEAETERCNRLSDDTLARMEDLPYLRPQIFKISKMKIAPEEYQNLWSPSSAIITSIAPPGSSKAFLCIWHRSPHAFTASEEAIASFTAVISGLIRARSV
jgi:hypothetical protein